MQQYQEIAAVITCFALACTLLTLRIISKMKWNGFLLLLTSLSISQFIFDTSFLFFYLYRYHWYYAIFLYVYIFGELTVALWTNLITLLTFRIVYTLKTVNIFQEYPYYLFIDLCVPFILDIYSAALHGLKIDVMNDAFRVFYWFRLMSVFFNIIFYGITQHNVSFLKVKVSEGKLSAVQAQAITVMVSRMKYYSVVQVLLILPGCVHAWNRETLADPTTNYLYYLTAPSCGIGYFLVFLTMQPTAMKIFQQELLRYLPFLRPLFPSKPDNVDEMLDTNTRESEVNGGGAPSERSIAQMSDDELSITIDNAKKDTSSLGLELKTNNPLQGAAGGGGTEERDSFDSDEDAMVGEPSDISLGTTSSVKHVGQVMV